MLVVVADWGGNLGWAGLGEMASFRVVGFADAMKIGVWNALDNLGVGNLTDVCAERYQVLSVSANCRLSEDGVDASKCYISKR